MVNFFYDMLYVFFIGLSESLLFLPGLFAETEEKSIILAVFLVCILVVGTRHLTGKGKMILPGLCALGVGIVWNCIEKEIRQEIFWSYRWVLLCLGFVLVAYIICIGILKTTYTGLALCALIAGYLLTKLILKNTLSKSLVVCLLFLLVILFIEETGKRWNRSGCTDRRGNLVLLAPFLGLYFVLLLVFPSSDKPFDWSFAQNIWEMTVDNFHIVGNLFHGGDENYGGAAIGFSENSGFMGELFDDRKEIMEITTTSKNEEALYLTGKSFDTFDGRQWTNSSHQVENSRMMDTMETYASVYHYDQDYIQNYVRRVSIEIRYLKFRTSYIFAPSKVILGRTTWKDMPYSLQEESLLAEEKLGYDSRYTANYLRLNKDHRDFVQWLESDRQVDEEDWNAARQEFKLLDREEYSYQSYLTYKDTIKVNEADSFKVILPTRVKDMLEPVIQGKETDIDRLRAVENYLCGLKYTSSPGELPDKVKSPEDFLEYFLLEKREGFCSHFATTFALYARSLGLPVRYVQGFYGKRGKTNQLLITSNMAHAWVEVYFDNGGWIPFDPTPSFHQSSYWAVKKHQIEEEIATKPQWAPEIIVGEETDTQNLPEEKKSFPWRALLKVVLGIFTCFAILWTADRWYSRKWLANQNAQKQFTVYVRENLRLLTCLGAPMQPTETLEEYRKRLTEFSEPVLAFLPLYEEMLYGDKAVGKEDCQRAKKSGEILLKQLKDTDRKRYFWYLLTIRIKRN